MILVYTGNGKGKTCASVGQALRAYGHGLNVAFCQFMKSNVQAGEQKVLAELLGARFHIGGCGFFRKEEERPKHRAKALETLAWASEQLETCHMLVLDEILYALRAELVTRHEIEALIQKAEQKEHAVHIVLSGRDAPNWLIEIAHTVSVIQEEKHAWKAGIKATPGIEF